MKEQEFIKKSPKQINIDVRYSQDKDEDIVVEEATMRMDFESQLNDLINGTKTFKQKQNEI